jgi:hypothetical protein
MTPRPGHQVPFNLRHNPAEAVREANLQVGDKLVANSSIRAHGGLGLWEATRLTLLHIGNTECFWRKELATQSTDGFVTAGETSNPHLWGPVWVLQERDPSVTNLAEVDEDEAHLQKTAAEADEALFLMFETLAAVLGTVLSHQGKYMCAPDLRSRLELVAQAEGMLALLRKGRRDGATLRYIRAGLHPAQVVTCVYCGQEYPPGTPTSQADALTAHIKVCEKHPMRAAEQLIRDLKAAIGDMQTSMEANDADALANAAQTAYALLA